MDKSGGKGKRSPVAGTTSRRAYSIFGGIINLTQANATKSNAVVPPSSSSSATTSSGGNVSVGGGGGGGGGGTSHDPQGSSNVYTVTVTNSQAPPDCNTNPAKTYENVAAMKKKKSDQSSSTVSSLNNSHAHQGMKGNVSGRGGGNSSNASGPIGPAPRTLSILTALNELAISDEIAGPNPRTPSVSSSAPPKSRNSGGSSANNNGPNISKANLIHSSFHHPSKRTSGVYIPSHAHGAVERGAALESQMNVAASTSTPSASSQHPPYPSATPLPVYHPNNANRGFYSNTSGANNTTSSSRLKGYPPEPHRNAMPLPTCSSSSSTNNTLPAKFHTGNKSLGGHGESLGRRGAAKQQRDRSKSRTPDWIWKIFQLTKHGKLEELQQSLQGLDPTLIRHLADAKGNTVLHCAARGGHVNTLQWLVSVLGSQVTEALNDHNRAGRTVMLTALRKGQLQCLQWLIQHTKCGEKALVPSEGERSLLHHAASHGNLSVVRWLCSELIDKGIHVDIRDASGLTPLHEAAKSGQISVCHELILAGADPLSQTELAWRPSDLAIRHRHMECASYFMVAEAAGSLGNQLHSVLLAFNHLRQEHEELRSHFRETLRVGKWLAKERNDLIKHFPSQWSQESTTSSLLLGGTNNGARFSDMEHKLVVAEQGWKRISQNGDDTTEAHLSEEEALISNISSQELLHRRLAAVQIRHERNQSLGNSLSASSEEEEAYEENSSLSDASSSDMDVDGVTSVTAGSAGVINSPAVIHSTNVSPPSLENNTMKTRAKAAPWLLPPNDALLSQLSPFVGATHIGKSLPTLDLLHGAPGSPSLLSPIVTPSSSANNAAPATTTDAAGKNEKSLVQMDGEQHGESHLGKRDSLEISVLEVIEPPSHASSPSTSKKKGEDGVEQFHVSSSRPWLDFSDQRKGGMLRGLPKCAIKSTSPGLGIGGDEGKSCGGGVGGDATGRMSTLVVKGGSTQPSPDAPGKGGGAASGGLLRRKQGQNAAVEQNGQMLLNNVQQAPDLICGTHYRTRVGTSRRVQQPLMSTSAREREQPEDYYSYSRGDMLDPGGDSLYETISLCEHAQRKKSDHSDDGSKLETFFKSNVAIDQVKGGSLSKDKSRPSHGDGNMGGSEQLAGPCSSLSNSLSIPGDNENECVSSESTPVSMLYSGSEPICSNMANSNPDKINFNANSGGCSSALSIRSGTPSVGSGGGGTSRGIVSKTRTPSPRSYVTKLTVIPVETTSETCFLSMSSQPFSQEDQHQQDPHQLDLPGENQEELSLGSLSCQIPSDSVSSSNTPVMPRFSSSGTVVFPLRKPDWHSSEILSQITPDSSLAGRLSPTPSESSRTESALAPPPSYVSHASQNSEASKTESARGQTNEEAGAADGDLEDPDAPPEGYINDRRGSSDSYACIYQPAAVASSSPSSSSPASASAPGSRKNSKSSVLTMVEKLEEESRTASYDISQSDRKRKGDYSSVRRKDEDDDNNDGSSRKPSGIFGNQRLQAAPCFIRSHLSTGAGIHKVGGVQQRLPKGHRGQSKSRPWYEIEGSDDEGSLLRVAKSRSGYSSKFSSSSTPTSNNTTPGSSHQEESSSQNESEENDDGSGAEQEEAEEEDGNEGEGRRTTASSNSCSSESKQSSTKHNCSEYL